MSECNTSHNLCQIGAVTALEQGEEWVQRLALQYQAGRDIALGSQAIIPASKCSAPSAFYAFPRVRGIESSLDFYWCARRGERRAAGYTFGPGNEQHFRLCFAQSHERLREALKQVVRYIDRLPDLNPARILRP